MTCRDSYITSVDTAQARLDNIVSELETFDSMIKKQQTPTLLLDQENVQTATTMINTIFRAPTFNLQSFPALNDRLTNGPITTTELGDFAVQQGYIPITGLINDLVGDYTATVSDLTSPTPTQLDIVTTSPTPIRPTTTSSDLETVASELNMFYTNDFAASQTGGLCGLFSDAFADISALGTLIGKATKTLAEIKDLNLSDLAAKIKPLENLKKAVDGLIDDVRKSLTDRVDRILESSQKALQDLEQLSVGIAKDITREYNRLQRLLSDVNGKKLKEAMDQYLADAVNQFEDVIDNPGLIPYLAYRTCQTIGNIQSILEDPVNAFSDRLQTRISDATASNRFADEARARLQTNGGPRITRVSAAAAKRTAYGNLQGTSSGGSRLGSGNTIRTRPRGNTPIQYPLTGADIAIGNRFTIERSGNGRFTKVSNQFITLQPQVMNEGIDYPYNNDDDGWTMVDERVWALVWKLGQRMGKQLSINSAYRSPAKNAAVGGAKNSFHKQGMAVDISTRGGVDPVELVKNASLLGFKGIGGYRTFIHVDIRPYVATWNSGASSSVREALRIHASGTLTFDDTPNSSPKPDLPTAASPAPNITTTAI